MTKAAMAGHISILWAEVAQAEELARLHALLFDPAWDAASFRQLLGHPGSTAFMARASEPREMVGFVLGQLAADEAELVAVCVHKDWQRLGVGRRLVEALCTAAKKAEARQLHLEVAASNAAARTLYNQLGFRERGRRKGYYARAGATAEDAINLSLAL